MMGMGLPVGRSKDFRGAMRRLFAQLGPERPLIIVVVLLAIVSVTFVVIGPKLLGEATNVIFTGAVGAQFPAGATKDQVVAGLRAAGQDQLADLVASLPMTPGVGIDFAELGRLVVILVAIYLLSSLFAWMQGYIMTGVTQRTVYRLRQDDRSQARPDAAPLLRQPPARRRPEPGHERHRQHRPVAPAEPDPAHHVAPDHRRRADHDADDQSDPRC